MTGGDRVAAPVASRRREIVALLVILAAAALVRIAYLSEYARQPEFAVPEVDAAYNDYWARAMVTGDWSPPPDREDPQSRFLPYLRPPGYPFFLSALYRTLGTGHLAPRVVQAGIGVVSCLLGFLLARRRFGPAVALGFAALLGGYWSFVYFEGEYLEPVLLVFLGLLLLRILDGWTDGFGPAAAAAAGIVLGMAALVRPTVLPFGMAVPLWAWRFAKAGAPGTARKLLLLSLYGAAVLATLAPALVRNARVGGEAVLVSPSGLALYMGNHEGADGFVASELPGLGAYGSCFDYPAVYRALERRAGRALSPGEVSAHFRDEALRFMRENPRRVLSLLWKKTLLFFGPLEVGHNREDEIAREASGVLRRLPGGFPFAFSAFLLGLAIFAFDGGRGDREGAGRREAQAALLSLAALYVLCTFLAHVPFVVAGRYRVPMVPMLLLAGAYGAVRIVGMAREGRPAAAAAWAGGGILLYALLSLNPAGYAPDRAKWHFTRGSALARAGDAAGARKRYEEAIRRKPGYADAHVNLGNLDLAAGEPASAERHFRAALALSPDDFVARYDLGLALARSGRKGEAAAEFERALAVNPGFAPAHSDLADLLRESGDAVRAAHHYGEAAWIRRDAAALLELAAWLQSMGMEAEAEDPYRRALAIDPSLGGTGNR